MSALKDLHLVLFFTEGVSLDTWHQLGTLDRELAVYRAMRTRLRRPRFTTVRRSPCRSRFLACLL